MSVLIKGMEMPKHCNECRFECRAYCFLADTVIESNGRPDWCPLVEVPPHGRLIDADAILSQYNGNILTAQNDYAEGLRDAAEDIKTAPTIIEAEEDV